MFCKEKKKGPIPVSSFLQFTEEKLGQAEKTELDAHLENLIARGDCTKNWTEKIFRQTEVLLQPNPSKINSIYANCYVETFISQ